MALMLRYFEIDVKEQIIFCNGCQETYPTALDKALAPGSPLKLAFGKEPIVSFLRSFKKHCELYKNTYDKDVEDMAPVLEGLGSIQGCGLTWLKLQDALCDIIVCIKMDAVQRQERVSSWMKVRAYDFTLALRRRQLSRKNLHELATAGGIKEASQINKETSFLQNFSQSPELYIRNAATQRTHTEQMTTRDAQMTGAVKVLNEENSALKKEKVKLEKKLREKEAFVAKLPEWFDSSINCRYEDWQKLANADLIPHGHESEHAARVLMRAFDRYVALRKRAADARMPVKFLLADEDGKILFRSLPNLNPGPPESDTREVKESSLSVPKDDNAESCPNYEDKLVKEEDATMEEDEVVPRTRVYQLGVPDGSELLDYE